MIGDPAVKEPDVVLVGAGIMSATLGGVPEGARASLNIEMFETLGGAALESSNAWNNAGTGHAANCELNYTPERSDGSIDISEALRGQCRVRPVAPALVLSGEEAARSPIPQSFIHPVPHMSFVHGAENVAFLRKRFKAMSAHHCYRRHGVYRGQAQTRASGSPLVMEGRAAERANRRDADDHRRRRGLRRAHPQPRRLSRGHERLRGPLLSIA